MNVPVSIVINNFNYGEFLGEAIESALQQTYAPVEVIVVDDGSTDSSRQVISDFSSVIPVLKSNGGQGSAMNAGFRVSTGAIICFLDSDDTLDREAIACAVPAIQAAGAVKVHWRLR